MELTTWNPGRTIGTSAIFYHQAAWPEAMHEDDDGKPTGALRSPPGGSNPNSEPAPVARSPPRQKSPRVRKASAWSPSQIALEDIPGMSEGRVTQADPKFTVQFARNPSRFNAFVATYRQAPSACAAAKRHRRKNAPAKSGLARVA